MGLPFIKMLSSSINIYTLNVQPLLRAGKPLDLKDILHRVNIRKPKLVQQLGTNQVNHELDLLLITAHNIIYAYTVQYSN
tara:strand:- start:105 stop:344 length:240 start_codon:yes stop_codon:yes gene_type:complete